MPPPSCKLANCLKLREPPKTVQRRGVCANRLKSEAACSSITFHMREPAPSVLIKPPPAPAPRLPIHLSHGTLFLPSLHTSRESLSCSRSIESQPCGRYSMEGLIESLYAICLISPCIGSLVRFDVHPQRVCPAKKLLSWLPTILTRCPIQPRSHFSSVHCTVMSCHSWVGPNALPRPFFNEPARSAVLCLLINWHPQSYQLSPTLCTFTRLD